MNKIPLTPEEERQRQYLMNASNIDKSLKSLRNQRELEEQQIQKIGSPKQQTGPAKPIDETTMKKYQGAMKYSLPTYAASMPYTMKSRHYISDVEKLRASTPGGPPIRAGWGDAGGFLDPKTSIIGKTFYGSHSATMTNKAGIGQPIVNTLQGQGVGFETASKIAGSTMITAGLGQGALQIGSQVAMPTMAAGISPAMQARRLKGLRETRKELGPGSGAATAERAGAVSGAIRTGMYTPALTAMALPGILGGGTGMAYNTMKGAAFAVPQTIGKGVLGATGLSGVSADLTASAAASGAGFGTKLAAGAMSPMAMGSLTMAIPALVSAISGMKAEATRRRLRGKRESSFRIEKKYKQSQPLDTIITQLVSQEQLGGPDQIKIELLKMIEGHTSPIPMIGAIVKFIEDQRKKDLKASTDKYSEKQYDWEEEGFGKKPTFKQKASKWADIASTRLQQFSALSPMQQLATMIFEGKSPNEVRKEYRQQLRDIKRPEEQKAHLQKVSGMTGASIPFLRLMLTDSQSLIKMGESPESKMILLLSGSFDLQREYIKNWIENRKEIKEKGMKVEMEEPEEKKESFLMNIPGAHIFKGLFKGAKGAYGIGKDVYDSATGKKTWSETGIGSKVDDTIGKIQEKWKKFRMGEEAYSYLKDPDALKKKLGFFQTQEEKISMYQEKGLPDDMQDIKNTLYQIYEVNNKLLKAQTGQGHEFREAKIWDSLSGKAVTKDEYNLGIEDQEQKMQEEMSRVLKQKDKELVEKFGIGSTIKKMGLGVGGAASLAIFGSVFGLPLIPTLSMISLGVAGAAALGSTVYGSGMTKFGTTKDKDKEELAKKIKESSDKDKIKIKTTGQVFEADEYGNKIESKSPINEIQEDVSELLNLAKGIGVKSDVYVSMKRLLTEQTIPNEYLLEAPKDDKIIPREEISKFSEQQRVLVDARGKVVDINKNKVSKQFESQPQIMQMVVGQDFTSSREDSITSSNKQIGEVISLVQRRDEKEKITTAANTTDRHVGIEMKENEEKEKEKDNKKFRMSIQSSFERVIELLEVSGRIGKGEKKKKKGGILDNLKMFGLGLLGFLGAALPILAGLGIGLKTLGWLKDDEPEKVLATKTSLKVITRTAQIVDKARKAAKIAKIAKAAEAAKIAKTAKTAAGIAKEAKAVTGIAKEAKAVTGIAKVAKTSKTIKTGISAFGTGIKAIGKGYFAGDKQIVKKGINIAGKGLSETVKTGTKVAATKVGQSIGTATSKVGQSIGTKVGTGIKKTIGTVKGIKTGKDVVKAGTGLVGKGLSTGAKGVGFATSKVLAKKLPFLGAAVGITLGVGRALEGDLAGASLEVVSGLSSFLGPAGLPIGLSLDAYLYMRDVDRNLKKQIKEDQKEIDKINSKWSKKIKEKLSPAAYALLKDPNDKKEFGELVKNCIIVNNPSKIGPTWITKEEKDQKKITKSGPPAEIDKLKKEKEQKEMRSSRITPSISLGSLSAKHESRGGVGEVSIGVGDPGGVSYGSYQMKSKGFNNTVSQFVKLDQWSDKFKGLKPGTREFSDKWKEIAAENPKAFEKSQHEFMKQTHYDPILGAVREKTGLDVSQRSNALQQVLWSVGTQHGEKYGSGLIQKALKGKDTSSLSDSEIIKAIYKERRREGSRGKLAYFQKSADKLQSGLRNRFKTEEEDALTLLHNEASKVSSSGPSKILDTEKEDKEGILGTVFGKTKGVLSVAGNMVVNFFGKENIANAKDWSKEKSKNVKEWAKKEGVDTKFKDAKETVTEKGKKLAIDFVKGTVDVVADVPGFIAEKANQFWNEPIDEVKKMATGGFLSIGETAIVGEEGKPELIQATSEGTIVRNKQQLKQNPGKLNPQLLNNIEIQEQKKIPQAEETQTMKALKEIENRKIDAENREVPEMPMIIPGGAGLEPGGQAGTERFRNINATALRLIDDIFPNTILRLEGAIKSFAISQSPFQILR